MPSGAYNNPFWAGVTIVIGTSIMVCCAEITAIALRTCQGVLSSPSTRRSNSHRSPLSASCPHVLLHASPWPI
eukprot:scaffold895_cov109-Isochrysis_galbana.AAC.4